MQLRLHSMHSFTLIATKVAFGHRVATPVAFAGMFHTIQPKSSIQLRVCNACLHSLPSALAQLRPRRLRRYARVRQQHQRVIQQIRHFPRKARHVLGRCGQRYLRALLRHLLRDYATFPSRTARSCNSPPGAHAAAVGSPGKARRVSPAPIQPARTSVAKEPPGRSTTGRPCGMPGPSARTLNSSTSPSQSICPDDTRRIRPGRLPLVPQLLARAAVEVHLPGFDGALQRLAVHMRHHQHLAGRLVLAYRRDQTLSVELHLRILRGHHRSSPYLLKNVCYV